MNEKLQSNQRRDEVLRRMLNTPPQPKTASKSSKTASKTKSSEVTPSNPLKYKRESPLDLPSVREKPAEADPMPTDDPEALIEWGKRNIQNGD